MAENEERRVEAEKQSSNAKRSDKAANDEHRVTRHDAEQESGHCKDSYATGNKYHRGMAGARIPPQRPFNKPPQPRA